MGCRFGALSCFCFLDPRRTLGLNEFEVLRFVLLFWIPACAGMTRGGEAYCSGEVVRHLIGFVLYWGSGDGIGELSGVEAGYCR